MASLCRAAPPLAAQGAAKTISRRLLCGKRAFTESATASAVGTIGFVGLGAMGMPMATNLAKSAVSPSGLLVFDVDKVCVLPQLQLQSKSLLSVTHCVFSQS